MRLVAVLAVAGLCAACSTLPSGPGGDENFAAASPLGAELTIADARALRPAFVQAIEAGGIGERFDWRGPFASGWVKAREPRVGNLKADTNDRPPIPIGLDLGETYETEQGLHALTRNANVRLGPDTSFPSREQLVSGTGVEVIGKVVGKPWMLVEVDGRVAGYIHESLMVKAPGTELELAGGPRRRAVYCRAYEQKLSVNGGSEQWEGVACRENGRWALKPSAPDAPSTLF
jgi:surface antigen